MYKICIKRPVTTVMVMFIAILAGVVALLNLKLDLMPQMDIPVAVVSTTYVGAGPEEIESLITKPVEETMGTVSNVESITSTSSTNSSMVVIQFADGTDIDMAAVDMREKLDLMRSSLPEDAGEPLVMKIDLASMSNLIIGVHSEKMDMQELTSLLEDSIVNRLERIEGVASVSLTGAVEDEVQVILNPERMQGYGLSTTQLIGTLQAENINLPAGEIEQGTARLQLRSTGEFSSLDDIRNLPITTPAGALIHLRDVAEVRIAEKDEDSYALIDGEKSILLTIQKQSNANVVDVSDCVTKELKEISQDYPELTISTLSNTSEYIRSSVSNVLDTAVQAAIMAVIVLFLFLRSAKSSLIIAISIPTSIIFTFALMYVSDMTLNIISLGGLTIGVGMLVDNSVVVLECIYRHYMQGESPTEAAMNGAREVSLSVMASTLTTVAVFLPLSFVEGVFGQVFQSLSFTVSFSLLISLVVSLSFVPMACAKILSDKDRDVRGPRWLARFLNGWKYGLDKIDSGYRGLLAKSLRHKKITVLIVLLCFIGSMGLIPITGVNLMPEMDQGAASITIEMPKGTVLSETTKVVNQVISRIAGIPEMEEWYLMAGETSTDSATLSMNFVPRESRERSTDEITQELQSKMTDIAGAKITVSASSSAMGVFSAGADVQFNILGDTMDQLMEISSDVTDLLEKSGKFENVTSSISDPVPEANIRINRVKAAPYGVTASSIASALNMAVSGSTATTYRVGGDEIDVRVMQPEESVEYLSDLKNITVATALGTNIPLTEIADIEVRDGASEITRSDQHRDITISADTKGMDAATAQEELTALLDTYEFPSGCSYEFSGNLESLMESFQSLLIVLVVAILLVYMIMAAQFESFLYPFLIIFSLPLALTGGVLGLFLTGETITVVSMMGFIMLVGIVVNNAIVLVDYTNQLRRDRGMDCEEALLEAGPTRLRPILMTTLTTVMGMIPMALAISEGTEMQKPMAIVIIFGMVISTLVTLIFIPVLYSSVEKLRRKKRKS